MAQEMKPRRGYYGPLEGVDPESGKPRPIYISDRRLQWIATLGPAAIAECKGLVPQALRRPGTVFQGLRRDENEDRSGESEGWLCYVLVPDCAYDRKGEPREAWTGKVFLVFVNTDGVAYNWRWEKCDPASSELPVDYQARFKKRLL